MMVIDRDRIATMIPHAGAMCLLDGVLSWDAVSARCVSRCYQDHGNPLRRPDGVLGMACGIEIAAQAMALHGRLVVGGGGPPSQGYLASVRDVRFLAARLDDEPGDLIVDVERLMADMQGATYRFALSRGDTGLLNGRATVLFGVAP